MSLQTRVAAPVNIPPAGAGWYVAYSKPRAEAIARDQLAPQGYEVYLPLYKSTRRTAKGTEAVRVPMFARYLFFRAGRPGQSIAPARSTRGITSVVRFGAQFACVSNEVVETLREFEVRREQADLPECMRLTVGGRVVIHAGPLKGLEGLVSAVARERVTVLLDIMGRPQQLAMGIEQVEAVDA